MSERTAPKVPNLNLRFADETDVEIILRLIRGLADYERLSHEVTADSATLHRFLFGVRPAAEVVIAEVDGTPVGFALFFHSFSTFLGLPGIYIEDLYIEPAWRGKGIGRALLSYVARLAKERGCGRLEWAVLDWNAPAITRFTGNSAAACSTTGGFSGSRETPSMSCPANRQSHATSAESLDLIGSGFQPRSIYAPPISSLEATPTAEIDVKNVPSGTTPVRRRGSCPCAGAPPTAAHSRSHRPGLFQPTHR